jgi:hypothetical protein
MPRPRGSRARDPAEGRAEVLAALEAVDLVVVFEEDTPHELIKRGRPAVLVKGANYRIDALRTMPTVRSKGASSSNHLAAILPRRVRRALKYAISAPIRRRPEMSISQLVAAIDAVSRETRPEMRRSYMIAIKHGVKQIKDRLSAIEKRLEVLERRK